MVVVKLVMVHVKMAINLFEYQKQAIELLKSGSILVGGVGSGKSRTALAYYFIKECEGKIKINNVGGYSEMKKPKDLYIITTARKRDTFEWEQECNLFPLKNIKIVIDSWNNIYKYLNIKKAFFIFDEQRVIGKGVWVKSFLNITQNNNWILLSATPGDTWMDYVPVFIANGFYKNRTEFIRRHVVYNNFSKYPKIDRFVEVSKLIRLRNLIIVNMKYKKQTTSHEKKIVVGFDKELLNTIIIKRWNVYEQRPIKDVGELCYLMRRVVNSDSRRINIIEQLLEKHPRIIVFYNFNYERKLLLELAEKIDISIAEWNGHKHELIPKTDKWMYIVQYAAGAEGWNCVETDTIIFYSQNYSYKATVQAAGRIDRLNTSFSDLYYYYLYSNSIIDLAIKKAYDNKRNFNEHQFMSI